MTIDTDKDVLLVTSGGRTGTSFFAEVLDGIISDSFSVHEPDVWHGILRPDSWRAVRWFGVYHVIVGKFLRRTGMRCVGERYLAGDWSARETVAAIIQQRSAFYSSRDASLVIESNPQWYGLLPLLPDVLPSYKVLALVRDPRSWVQSWANYGGHHDEDDMVTRFGLPRLLPRMVDDEWADCWEEMDSFERLCWDWRFVTTRLMEAADNDAQIHLIRFEDLFYAHDRRDRLAETLDFLTDFGESRYSYEVPSDLFDHEVNVSRPKRLGPWQDWSEERQRFLVEMCGSAMERLGYSLEDDPEASGGSGD